MAKRQNRKVAYRMETTSGNGIVTVSAARYVGQTDLVSCSVASCKAKQEYNDFTVALDAGIEHAQSH